MKTRMQKTVGKNAIDMNNFEIPEYTLGKRGVKRKKKSKIPKWLKITSGVLAVLLAFVYLLPLGFLEHNDLPLTSTALQGNDTTLQSSISYMRNNPDLDFDGDGLTNEQELKQNTGVYFVDTDGDFVTDYAELFITETSPTTPDDSIISYVQSLGGAANDPFKVHNVIMWADNFESKAKGSVIVLKDGYRFSYFDGWVQFPEGKYAYETVNGYQVPLKQNSNGQFYVNSSKDMVTVHVYEQELEMTNRLYLFGTAYYIDDAWYSKALSFVLPDYGTLPITCRRVPIMDVDGSNAETAKANNIKKMDLSVLDDSRFGLNQNTLEDLASVYTAIDNGEVVVASLYSFQTGEALVEIYGYTTKDNLLIADPTTGEALGYMNITEYGKRMLDNSSTIQQYEFFGWSACGFSSSANCRISFPMTTKA